MNVSTSSKLIKLLVVAIWPLGGCGATIAEAPFAARPGSVERGDLRGPFDGQVLDRESGKPLGGAAVVGSWAFASGVGLAGPAGAETRRTETDADGRYRFEALDGRIEGRLERFTLIVYKRGQIAYRSDRHYADLSARGDFLQQGNTVRLERFPVDGSHVRHLRFVGAGGPLLADLAPELQQAADESNAATKASEAGAATPEAGAAGGPLLDASQLLSPDELKAVTGYKGEFSIGKLGDLPSSAQYDSAHFRAVDQPEKFDAALRLFKSDPAEAERRYEKLLQEYPAADEKNEVGSRSLRAHEGDILAVAALDRPRGLVVVFTCGVGQCRDVDTAVALLRRMWPRLDRAANPPTAAPVEKSGEKPTHEAPSPGVPAPSGPMRLKPPDPGLLP